MLAALVLLALVASPSAAPKPRKPAPAARPAPRAGPPPAQKPAQTPAPQCPRRPDIRAYGADAVVDAAKVKLWS